jgi:Mn-dependent DtxR family transcriptional regulator
MGHMAKTRIDVTKLAYYLLLQGHIYVSVKTLSRILGISTRSAGRILAEMEKYGLARRWSRRTYKLLARAGGTVESNG